MLWGLVASVEGFWGLGAEVLTAREERTLEDMLRGMRGMWMGCVDVCMCVRMLDGWLE